MMTVSLRVRLLPLVAGLFLYGCAVPQPEILIPEPSDNAAVLTLLAQAQSQQSAGQLTSAGASLERALRIEPGNPVLWQRLAQVRFEQGKYQQAENLAAKANTLSGGNKRLRAENWRLIGQARNEQGDYAGAQAAFERAEER
jgi:predicted Zn-dependent protease